MVLGLLVWRLGTGPFLEGLRLVDGRSLVAAGCIAVVTTLCCAWRWSIVARGLGVPVPLPTAFAACYRSQFLNTTLPGGVIGDVERGVRHGRDSGDNARALRAVAWERLAGQSVQVVVALTVLLLLPSPLRSSMPELAIWGVLGTLATVVVWRALPGAGATLAGRTVRTMTSDLRDGLLARRAWPGIVLASTVAVAGHALTFLVAARTVGSTAPVAQLLPLGLLVLLAMGVPTNVAGWGPREGVAAWAFGAAGLGAAQGVAAAVVYGVMVLVASLPGAFVVVAQWRRRTSGGPDLAGSTAPAVPIPEGAARG